MRRCAFLLVSTFFALWPHVHAGQADPTNDQEPVRPFRYAADRYRDPFVPKSMVRREAEASLPRQAVNPVKVVGILASAQGRWALLERRDGARRIVTVGEVLAAPSRVVKRITEHEVTLAVVEGKTGGASQAERIYVLDEE